MTSLMRERTLLSLLKSRLAGPHLRPFELKGLDGSIHRFGDQRGDPAFQLHSRTKRGMRALASLDQLAIAEAYVNGDVDFSGDFLAALDLRQFFTDHHPLHRAWGFLRTLLYGRAKIERTLVPRHYDRGNGFYLAFLDKKHRMYSHAVYTSEDETLEQAAERKLEYIREVCRLKPGSRVLDVGAGWGSFAQYAASRGIHVTMLTISHEQKKYLTELCSHGLPGDLHLAFESVYAHQPPEPYDAIVILGVMEHLPDYPSLLARLDQLLKPHGRVYMCFCAIRKKYAMSTVTYRHVYQGNQSPVVLPELVAAAQASPFELIEVHNDRHSYFLTLRAWARNLEAAHDDVSRHFGEAAYRLFRMYLWATAHAMRAGALEGYRAVFQKSRGSPSSMIGLKEPSTSVVPFNRERKDARVHALR